MATAAAPAAPGARELAEISTIALRLSALDVNAVNSVTERKRKWVVASIADEPLKQLKRPQAPPDRRAVAATAALMLRASAPAVVALGDAVTRCLCGTSAAAAAPAGWIAGLLRKRCATRAKRSPHAPRRSRPPAASLIAPLQLPHRPSLPLSPATPTSRCSPGACRRGASCRRRSAGRPTRCQARPAAGAARPRLASSLRYMTQR